MVLLQSEIAAAPDSTLREGTISPGNWLRAVVPNQASEFGTQ
jgi:hypothetical protein